MIPCVCVGQLVRATEFELVRLVWVRVSRCERFACFFEVEMSQNSVATGIVKDG